MKKFVSLLLVAMLVMSLFTGCSSGGDKKVLKIYNAGEYIDMSLITEFEKANNCTVVYETFDSNESLYTKLMSGESYDVLVPSDYMIERLIKEDYLQPVDWSKISNKDNLMAEVMNQPYDPDNTYSVPYFWGSVGILYDTTEVDAADVESGWDMLTNTKYAGNIYMYDSERDSFMVALKALGYSMNTTDTAEIDAAYEWLVAQRDSMNPVYVGDDVMDNMISGNKAMAVVYSGDAAYSMMENPNLAYVTPNQGTNIWYDAMVITKNCTETDLAHKFIDFMISEESAMANTVEVGYTSTVKSVYDEMVAGEYADINAYIVETGYEKDEVFSYQEAEVKKYYADLWTKVKAY